ncbi:hypothetical protein [Sphaerisporangium sp. TRM90804]|uniref:hypothetical protein n=1 Tax=Sphaerisporangium sp. TRM90804 TaxID=3031113 RepID=UPI00244D5743|nr:hypothetical protein [Sphaerisporangium sp. TRM90804]MDH2429868.1 hypothetical protein [Sphaerisporangium sp. TRM90804]
MLVLLAVAALAVLYCVVIVSQGRGGELVEFAPDVPPLDLPEPGQLTAVDFMAVQLPVSLVGYHTPSVDETLQRAAAAIGERDTHIAVLEQRLAELMAGRFQARQESYIRPSWAGSAPAAAAEDDTPPGVPGAERVAGPARSSFEAVEPTPFPSHEDDRESFTRGEADPGSSSHRDGEPGGFAQREGDPESSSRRDGERDGFARREGDPGAFSRRDGDSDGSGRRADASAASSETGGDERDSSASSRESFQPVAGEGGAAAVSPYPRDPFDPAGAHGAPARGAFEPAGDEREVPEGSGGRRDPFEPAEGSRGRRPASNGLDVPAGDGSEPEETRRPPRS